MRISWRSTGFAARPTNSGCVFTSLRRSAAALLKSSAQHRFVQPQLLRDAGGPFRAQYPIRNLLHIRQQKIDGSQLAFRGGHIHMSRTRNQVIDVRRRFFDQLDVSVRALLADEFVRIGLARERQDADFKILLQENGDGPLGSRLARGVGIVVHDYAFGEPTE